MSVWVKIEAADVVAAMPHELVSAYAYFLGTYSARSGRLAVLVARAVADFRRAVEAEGVEEMDADVHALPERCEIHVLATVLFQLTVEMSAPVDKIGGDLGAYPDAPGVSGLQVMYREACNYKARMYAGRTRGGVPAAIAEVVTEVVGTPRQGVAAIPPVRGLA